MSEVIAKTQFDENENHVCPPGMIRRFDNFLRPLVHPPHKVFGPHVKNGMCVLDVGCGGGFSTVNMAQLVGENGEIVAVDLQQEMLDMTAARAEKLGLSERIHFHRCQQDRLGVIGLFDFALAFWMLHETPDPQAFLKEVYSLLKPGGRILIVEPKFHVSRALLNQEVDRAAGFGFRLVERPKIRLSHTALLEKTA